MLLSCQEDDLNADASDEPRPAEFKMLPEENRSVIWPRPRWGIHFILCRSMNPV